MGSNPVYLYFFSNLPVWAEQNEPYAYVRVKAKIKKFEFMLYLSYNHCTKAKE
jgi:hypothetical protein